MATKNSKELKGKGQTVLITGASSGIGYELARCFARDGFSLVLASLPTEQISHSLNRLHDEFPQAQIESHAVDLSRIDGVYDLYQATRGKQIDYLINNAGFGQHGFFAETDLEREVHMIGLNITALIALTKLYLPAMIERKKGGVLNVASEAAFGPNPLLSVYGATKAFVLSFSQALTDELKDVGVTVTALCPPPTDTNFFKVARMEDSAAAKGPLRSAEEVAKDGFEGLMGGQTRVFSGPMTKIESVMGALLPDTVMSKVSRKKLESTATKSQKVPSADKARKAVTKATSSSKKSSAGLETAMAGDGMSQGKQPGKTSQQGGSPMTASGVLGGGTPETIGAESELKS